MLTEHLSIEKPLPTQFSPELAKRLFFVSDQIVDFNLVEQGGYIRGVEVTTSNPVDVAELAGKVNSLASDVALQRIIPSRQIWQSTATRNYQLDLFDQLVARGIAFEPGEGQVGFSEPFIGLMDCFDLQLKTLVMNSLNAKEYRYPTLIPTQALEKVGYFTSFPHLLMFVTRLHSDIDLYRSFMAEYQDRQAVDAYLLTYCQNTDYCLPPTMCYHTYHQYRNRTLAPETDFVLTSKGKSFRFESKYYRTFERLWDFTIREIVFVGSRDFVLDCRQKFMDLAIEFITRLGLTGYCEVANDPFFINLDTAEKIWSQRLLELKYELRLNIAPDRSIAVGSFNFHDNFFGQGFNIKRGEDWIRTGCVGFGLERLTYAFLCQYGLNAQAWPAEVRDQVSS